MRGFLKVYEDITVTFETAWLQLLPDINSQVDWLSNGFIFTMEEQLRKHVHSKERASIGRKTVKICLAADA